MTRAAPRFAERDLERAVLLDLGREPDVLLAKNEVGLGYRAALGAELCPSCSAAAKRHRTRYGLGVGSPDLVGAVGGRFLGLELKAPDGVVSDDQARWHAAARVRGVDIVVVRSVEEARAAIEEARRR